MDYLCRDQLFTFAGKPGRFHSKAHIQELLDHARVVVAEGPLFTPSGKADGLHLRTEIAYERTRDALLIERVNDLFDTRSLMHEKVYQCGWAPPPSPPLPSSSASWGLCRPRATLTSAGRRAATAGAQRPAALTIPVQGAWILECMRSEPCRAC